MDTYPVFHGDSPTSVYLSSYDTTLVEQKEETRLITKPDSFGVKFTLKKLAPASHIGTLKDLPRIPIDDLVEAVEHHLPYITLQFQRCWTLLRQTLTYHTPGLGKYKVEVIRNNQVYLDLNETIYDNPTEKTVSRMVDLVNARNVVMHSLTGIEECWSSNYEHKTYCFPNQLEWWWSQVRQMYCELPQAPYFPTTYGLVPVQKYLPGDNRMEYGLIQERCYGNMVDAKGNVIAIPEVDKDAAFKSLILAVYALHERKIAHRNIKPDNILRGENGTFKLTGLGFATKDGRNEFCLAYGTIGYASPERWKTIANFYHRRLENHRPIDIAALQQLDMWSLGIVLYQLEFGKDPYFLTPSLKQMTWEKLFEDYCDSWSVYRSVERLTHPDSQEYKTFHKEFLPTCGNHPIRTRLIQGCLCVDPKKRLTSAQAYAIAFPPLPPSASHISVNPYSGNFEGDKSCPPVTRALSPALSSFIL